VANRVQFVRNSNLGTGPPERPVFAASSAVCRCAAMAGQEAGRGNACALLYARRKTMAGDDLSKQPTGSNLQPSGQAPFGNPQDSWSTKSRPGPKRSPQFSGPSCRCERELAEAFETPRRMSHQMSRLPSNNRFLTVLSSAGNLRSDVLKSGPGSNNQANPAFVLQSSRWSWSDRGGEWPVDDFRAWFRRDLLALATIHDRCPR
jgi:hypothetical protein